MMKTGKTPSLAQFVGTAIVLFTGGVGTYVKMSNDLAVQKTKIEYLESRLVQSDTRAQVSRAARDAQFKALEEKINSNTQDIAILKNHK